MGRLSRLFRGFLGLFISGQEERNLEALMEAAREFATKWRNTTLQQMAGVAERLKNQIKARPRAQDLELGFCKSSGRQYGTGGTLARGFRNSRQT
jgi:hypothetical protein